MKVYKQNVIKAQVIEDICTQAERMIHDAKTSLEFSRHSLEIYCNDWESEHPGQPMDETLWGYTSRIDDIEEYEERIKQYTAIINLLSKS